MKSLREEQASEVFVGILGQLLAGGQVVIDDTRNPKEHPASVTVSGYKDSRYVYLLPDIALREVNKVQQIHFATTAIEMQLKEDGILLPGPSYLRTQKRVRGSRVRLWRMTMQSFDEAIEPIETQVK